MDRVRLQLSAQSTGRCESGAQRLSVHIGAPVPQHRQLGVQQEQQSAPAVSGTLRNVRRQIDQTGPKTAQPQADLRWSSLDATGRHDGGPRHR